MQKKCKSEFYLFSWCLGLQNLDVSFAKFTSELVFKSFSGTNNSLELPVLGFSIV